jgi:hypothetical protein
MHRERGKGIWSDTPGGKPDWSRTGLSRESDVRGRWNSAENFDREINL